MKKKRKGQSAGYSLSSLPGTNRKLKHLWIAAKGACYYCKRLTHIDGRNLPHEQPPTAATIEHLYPRSDLRRLILRDSQYTVLACHGCNKEKGLEWDSRTRHVEHEPISLIELVQSHP